MRYLAPAKLNLFLHVTGRRLDGFHDIETVFQLVDLCDDVEVATRTDGQVIRDPPPSAPVLAGLDDNEDLTVRAARLLKKVSGTELGASIHVTKRIPSGGGLGGGSSDAATVLLALNQQWSLNWSVERLAALGLELGSDVPVFIHGHNAWAGGRGEQLVPVDLPQRWYLIIHPGVSVSTAEVFTAAELTRDTPASRIAAVPAGGGRNDFEPVVRRRYPEVAAALDWLGARVPAKLTGTGSCLFAAFEDADAATQLLAQLPRQWNGYVARSL